MNDILNLLPRWLLGFYIFLFGICIGSFLNVVILRGLSGEDIVFGRSHCPKCKNNLKWYMNIPLFSYLFLKGRCAFCKCKISIQYPIIEFLNGVGYLCIFHAFGFSIKSLLFCAIISLFIVLATTDILETVIIDWHSYLLFIVCIITSYALGYDIFATFFVSFLVFILFEILSLFCVSILGIRCFGFGDSLMLLGISALFGIKDIFLIIFLSFIVQMILSLIPLLKAKNYKLFSMMNLALVIFALNSILLYKSSTYIKPMFYFSMAILLLVLCFAIIDIIKKAYILEPSEIENNNENIDKKEFLNGFLKIFFTFPYLAIKFLKTNNKPSAFAYLFFVPLVLYLGVYAYLLKSSIITTSFAIIDIVLLIYFVFTISSNEESVYNLLLEADTNLSEDSNESENIEKEFTLLPFGPALIISSIICIFYIDEIKIFLKTVYESYFAIIVNNL